KTFERAVLYPMVVGEVDAGNLGWVLDEVGRELARQSGEAPDGWVNDVIVLYYQGQDWVGPDGRRWVHTSRSKRYAEAADARTAAADDRGRPAVAPTRPLQPSTPRSGLVGTSGPTVTAAGRIRTGRPAGSQLGQRFRRP